MAFYTMRHTDDRGVYGQLHYYTSEDGRLTVVVSEHRFVSNRKMTSVLRVDTTYEDSRGGAWAWFNPAGLWSTTRDKGGHDRHRVIANDARVFPPTPENEFALVAECAAMYRDGVKTYEADGWTPCEVTPECLEYWMRFRRGEN